MANIDPFYFSLYAVLRRTGVDANGYYHEQPFYSPPKLGDTYTETKEAVTDDDWGVAVSIANSVNRIRHSDKKRRLLADALDIWEGAYPGAPPSKAARCKDNGVQYNQCRKAADRCKQLVERDMYGG